MTDLTLSMALDDWYRSLAAGDTVGSARTLQAYHYGTDRLLAALGATHSLVNVTTSDIEGLLADLKAQGLSVGTRALIYRPIRQFFRWCVARRLLTESPVLPIKAPRAQAQPVPFVTDAEWAAILATTDTGRRKPRPRDVRDRALLLFLGMTGARVSEVAGIRLGDIRVVDGKRRVLLHGKGSKDRMVSISPEVGDALDAYIARGRKGYILSTFSDALWLAPKGALTANGIAQLLAERGYQAGMTRRVHPHELRHRATYKAIDRGVPLPLIAQYLGHSTTAMVEKVYGLYGRAEQAADAFERAFS
jgi:site-specific recombinase XerD